MYNKTNLFETRDQTRWNALQKSASIVVVDSYAHGESCVKFTEWFSNFINALNYALDGPNFKATFMGVIKLVCSAAYLTVHPKISRYHRMCNALSPNLDITKLIYDTYEATIVHKAFIVIRSSIRRDYAVILHEFDKVVEVKYGTRRNDYNKDLHFRIMTDMDVKFNTNWRMVKKEKLRLRNNIIGYLAYTLYNKWVPEYDVIFYLHGGGFLSNSSEAHSDYLRR
jgi:hypothetical protein